MVDEMRDFTSRLGSDCPSKKLCVNCGTSKTPLWRGGPAGPKSLCNACGIRSRKKRWALLQITKVSEKNTKHETIDTNTNSYTNGSNCNSSSISSSNGNGEGGGNHSSDSFSKDKLIEMWQVLKPNNVRIEELNEDQQAAVLLMALSHGFNYS